LLDGSHHQFWAFERRESVVAALLIVAGGIAVPLLALYKLDADTQSAPELRLDPLFMNTVRLLWSVVGLFCICGLAWLISGIRQIGHPHLVGLETTSTGVTEFLSDGTNTQKSWPDCLQRRQSLRSGFSRCYTRQCCEFITRRCAVRALWLGRPRRYSPIIKIRLTVAVAVLSWTAINALVLFLYLSPPDPARHQRPLPFSVLIAFVLFWTSLTFGPLLAEFIINSRRPTRPRP
jgi:hypothetical protein